MSLETPWKVRKLQRSLYAKAKGSPEYRFYALYDKVYREDLLRFAYDRSAENGGEAGVDGQSFAEIETLGVVRWLGELAADLRNKESRLSRLQGPPSTERGDLGLCLGAESEIRGRCHPVSRRLAAWRAGAHPIHALGAPRDASGAETLPAAQVLRREREDKAG